MTEHSAVAWPRRITVISIGVLALLAHLSVAFGSGPATLLGQAVQLRNDEPERALELAQAAAAQAAGQGLVKDQFDALLVVGGCQAKLGQFEQAQISYGEAKQIAAARLELKDVLQALGKASGLYFRRGDYRMARACEAECLSLAQEAGDLKEAAQAHNDLGVISKKLGEFDEAEQHHMEALKARELIGDRRGEAQSLNNLGILHKDQGNYYTALRYQEQSIAIKRELEPGHGSPALARSYNNLGILYRHLDDLEQARHYMDMALEIYQAGDHEAGMSSVLSNLGSVYSDQGMYARALELHQQALAIDKRTGDRPGMASNLTEIGAIHRELGQPLAALEHLERALALHEETGGALPAASTRLEVGITLRQLGRNDEARLVLEQAATALEAMGARPLLAEVHRELSEVSAALGDYQSAFEFQRRYAELNVESVTEESRRRIADLEASRRVAAKEAEITILERDGRIQQLEVDRQRTLKNVSLGALVTVVVVAVMGYRRYRRSQTTNALLRERGEQIQYQNTVMESIVDELEGKKGELEQANTALYVASVTDPLTGVANRSHLMDTLTREISLARRHGHHLACLMVDIDHFKAINDLHGHLVGDSMLTRATHIIASQLRTEDLLARYGGEEFVVVLPRTDQAGALAVAEKIRRTLEASTYDCEGQKLRITVSVGVSTLDDDPHTDIDVLLGRADAALYRAKDAGRNRTEVA